LNRIAVRKCHLLTMWPSGASKSPSVSARKWWYRNAAAYVHSSLKVRELYHFSGCSAQTSGMGRNREVRKASTGMGPRENFSGSASSLGTGI